MLDLQAGFTGTDFAGMGRSTWDWWTTLFRSIFIGFSSSRTQAFLFFYMPLTHLDSQVAAWDPACWGSERDVQFSSSDFDRSSPPSTSFPWMPSWPVHGDHPHPAAPSSVQQFRGLSHTSSLAPTLTKSHPYARVRTLHGLCANKKLQGPRVINGCLLSIVDGGTVHSVGNVSGLF